MSETELTPREKKIIQETARSAVKRYRNQALVGFLILLVGIAAGFYTRGQDQDALNKKFAKSDAAIVSTIKINCQFGDLLRDGVNSIFLRAYGNIEPDRARDLAAQTGLPEQVIPDHPTSNPNKLSPAQRRANQIFFERSILALDAVECHVPANAPKS